MAIIKEDELKRVILEKYGQAKQTLNTNKLLLEKYGAAVSDRIPGYEAEKMKFGAYHKDEFVAFFADMRGSSKRAKDLRPEDNFLTLHAVMPALIYIVEKYGGYVIDLPGDGIMALFKEGENRKSIQWSESKKDLNTKELAVCCGEELLSSISRVVNPILLSDNIPSVVFGVGIDSGPVVVTKTGTDGTFDTKALGDCVNMAAKKSHGHNEIWVSKNTYDKLPTSQGLQRSLDEPEWYIKKVN
ncbi:class 3 adenylate cyclase [Aneurinibacillus soli]|uniref:Adenylate and Guanylate cyclase catalytic domain protein n=1 Tax=Aneurinibacillus soli TaxID=1500254 RepID=A0A0U5BHK5_9BACL|nr:adenylate/guanylate cyclase domain-containing protein [Aneurinibacillus soli]PYE63422.1 class 3 adenylate cyclase [Aneurinibacillus soli]BAU27646.1 Adenylate and Guanylate cyclase catalytic domain protein [Aneurinibacillus soli]